MNINTTIIAQTILYGHPAVLFKCGDVYAWKYRGEVENLNEKFKDLGEMTEEKAITKFKWNFNDRIE